MPHEYLEATMQSAELVAENADADLECGARNSCVAMMRIGRDLHRSLPWTNTMRGRVG